MTHFEAAQGSEQSLREGLSIQDVYINFITCFSSLLCFGSLSGPEGSSTGGLFLFLS